MRGDRSGTFKWNLSTVGKTMNMLKISFFLQAITVSCNSYLEKYCVEFVSPVENYTVSRRFRHFLHPLNHFNSDLQFEEAAASLVCCFFAWEQIRSTSVFLSGVKGWINSTCCLYLLLGKSHQVTSCTRDKCPARGPRTSPDGRGLAFSSAASDVGMFSHSFSSSAALWFKDMATKGAAVEVATVLTCFMDFWAEQEGLTQSISIKIRQLSTLFFFLQRFDIPVSLTKLNVHVLSEHNFLGKWTTHQNKLTN